MIRRLFFFALGLCLGAFSVLSFAATVSRIPVNISVSAPANVAVSGAWDAVVPGLEDIGYGGYRPSDFGGGRAEIYRGAAVRVDGVPASLTASRSITPARLGSAISRGLRRPGVPNPYMLAFGVLADLGWQYVADEWLVPPAAPLYPYSREFSGSTGGQAPWFPTPEEACVSLLAQEGRTFYGVRYIGGNPVCKYRPDNPGYWSALAFRARPCDAGFVEVSGNCVPQNQNPRPATEQEMSDALTDNLVNGDLSPEQALQEAVENGWVDDSDFDPTAVTGPASINGPSTTSTTSGPTGQTQTTTQNRYDMEYVPGGVVIKPTTTTTTTTPDGQTSTTTTTTNGAAGQKPAEPEKPLCELFPNASGCEELGTPDDDFELEQDDLDIGSLTYQSVAGSCPADIVITPSLAGRSFTLSYQPVCTAAEFLRPLVIALGLLTAGLFVFGRVKEG